jgi:hypothetical protein
LRALNSGRRALVLALLALAGIAAGCETTRITSEWRDPSLARVPFHKVLVVFQHADAGLRRIVEDEMARDIPGATPAYTLFRDQELRDVGRVKERVRELGFDSSVIMRVEGVEHERTYVPGQVYAAPGYAGGFWGYWGTGWTMVYEPGYLRQDRIVRIATNVYAVQADKLVWASESETFNPASLRDAIAEVARVTAKATAKAMHERS